MRERSSLRSIEIRNLGVIESCALEFSKGLTVLTGETGAGKTMVLTALSLILGDRADTNLIRNGSERALVNGVFDLPEVLVPSIQDLDFEVEDGELIFSRILSESGKGKLLIGGLNTPLSKGSELGERLVEIHGQSTSNRLAKNSVQRELLDSFMNQPGLLDSYQVLHQTFKDKESEIAQLESAAANKEKEIAKLNEYLVIQEKIKVKPDELKELESEIEKISGSAQISEGISNSLNVLGDENDSVVHSIKTALKYLSNLTKYDVNLEKIANGLEAGLDDIAIAQSELTAYLNGLDSDPAYFDSLQNRKAELNALSKRFNFSADKNENLNLFIQESESARRRISDLDGGDGRIADLRRELDEIFGKLKKSGTELSKARVTAGKLLAQEIAVELEDLAMPNAQISFEIVSADFQNRKSYQTFGLDEVHMNFRSHPSAKWSPLAKSASGGELSRVMLALEVVLSRLSAVGTFIFDEVDAGVGGKAAMEVGRKLAHIAKNSQVIVITHLAQVAVWAEKHFVVEKNENGDVSESSVFEVDGARREVEIARLLSGQADSNSAQEHAAELLTLASKSMIS